MKDIEKKLVKKYFKIKNPYEEGILKVVDLEDAVEIATKSFWKYPDKNELPKNGSQIIVATENCDITLCAEYLFDKFVIMNTTKELYNKVIAWCYPPIFDKA